MKMWPSRQQWNSWSLPSKLSAIGVLIGVVSLLVSVGIYAIPVVIRWIWPPRTTVTLTVTITNPGESSVAIEKRASLFLTKYQEGMTAIEVMLPQECELLSSNGREIKGDLIEIAPGESVFKVEIPNSYLRALQTGEWDVFMGFDRGDGGSFASDSVPFTQEVIAERSLLANIGK